MRDNRPRLRDLAAEAWRALLDRPTRGFLTALGTVLGIATLVAIVGLTSSAQAQVSSRFDAYAATQVTLQDQRPGAVAAFPESTESTLNRLNGVEASGVLWSVQGDKVVTPPTPTGPADFQGNLFAASPGAFSAISAKWSSGAAYDRFTEARGAQVAVLGSAAARELGIARAGPDEAFFINGRPFTVVGIMASADRRPDLLLGILVPTMTATRLWGPDDSAQAIIVTRPGATRLIARQAPVALHPEDPTRLAAVVPPDPGQLRQQVSSDLRCWSFPWRGSA